MDWDESSNFFNWLEGGVCAVCAPEDQKESCGSQCEEGFLGLLGRSRKVPAFSQRSRVAAPAAQLINDAAR